HISANIPNMMLLETGHNLLLQWTPDIITNPVVIEDGHMALPEGPGLGMALQEDFLNRPDMVRTVVE
ncbi:MAG: enolase C-terminal domain-like protein, partial [SAR202 cluster bacterium]|nr:enolase C-terminal domain-like protein [SAR202 cluster bacterium]